ncbi:MAG TPA: hypothetical protein VMK66_19330 [Myxococcales bacterium]|nr:hypothetical protein [Myxococcales bacterium]
MTDPATQEAGDPSVLVPVDGTPLLGQLFLPPSPVGLALIAKLEQGGPAAEAYAAMAKILGKRGFAWLLFTVSTHNEALLNASTGWLRSDVSLIADRISAALHWAAAQPKLGRLSIGLLGVDTVGAAALVVASETHPQLAAVVGCNARTDLVDRVLGRIAVPTLLIAGSRGTELLVANRAALAELRCEKRLVIAAGHLKPTLEGRAARRVASLSSRWFERHMARRAALQAGGMR